MDKKVIRYVFALFVFISPIYVYLNPPTDTDGGPMLAYNLLFFFPLLIVATVISSILIIGTIKNFRNDPIVNSLILCSTLPTILLLMSVLIHIYRTQKEVPKEVTETNVSTITIKINEKLTLSLDGYTYKMMRKKVTFTPDKENRNHYTSHQFAQGKYESFYLYYKVGNDSLEIYIPDDEPLYYMDDHLKKLPLKVFYMKKSDFTTLNKKELSQFIWQ